MNKNPKVSIIIALYVVNKRFFDDLKRFKKLNYNNYEIILVADKEVDIGQPGIRLILTHKSKTGPAEKRDLGLKYAKGEICAFIDDDAYPDIDWLKNAIGNFTKGKIAAVGGPGITPPEDGYWEQITGLIYKSYFCGGHTQHRFIKSYKRYINDYPAYNLLVRTSVLRSVGGYGSYYYGGEDTFLCLKIIKKGWKILYDPNVVVFHHRRPFPIPYLKQIANIGLHRGYFAKKYPETSRRPSYFLPTILTIGFVFGVAGSFFSRFICQLYLLIFLFFYFLAIFSIIRKSDPIRAMIVGLGIILTHIIYGTYFLKGLLTIKLEH